MWYGRNLQNGRLSMKQKLLKALLGKFICSQQHLGYCHIDRVIIIEDNRAIITAIVKTVNGVDLFWILEATWQTDCYGVHNIEKYLILKEYEIYGDYPTKNKIV